MILEFVLSSLLHRHSALAFLFSFICLDEKPANQPATTDTKISKRKQAEKNKRAEKSKQVDVPLDERDNAVVKLKNCFLVFFTQKELDEKSKLYFDPSHKLASELRNCMVITRELFGQLLTRSLWVEVPVNLKEQRKTGGVKSTTAGLES